MSLDLIGRGRDFIASRLYPFAVQSWQHYGARVRASARSASAAGFQATGWQSGVLTRGTTETLRSAIDVAKPQIFRKRAVRWSYFYPASTDERRLNEANVFYRLDREQLNVFEAVLRELREPITLAMGGPWRAVNVRYWTTRHTSNPYGGNAWHRDGMPEPILKVMIYPDGASRELGTTELVDLSGKPQEVVGPAGTWLLFQNSVLEHRGVPSKSGVRRIVEFTVAPARSISLEPIAAGSNAQYPFVPWLK